MDVCTSRCKAHKAAENKSRLKSAPEYFKIFDFIAALEGKGAFGNMVERRLFEL